MPNQFQPAAFVSHGSPMVAIEPGAFQLALAKYASALHPSSILVVSAHWDSGATIRITSGERNSLIYDFGGFPRALYDVRYDAPGSPGLAQQVASILSPTSSVALDPERGLDHGAWVPLRLMFPNADVPVVELSIPTSFSPQRLFELGVLLAPVREKGTLILGSGGIVHNLRRLDFRNQNGEPEAWARQFDQWVAGCVQRRDYPALFSYASQPYAAEAVPTPEHFLPIFVVLGAAEAAANDKALDLIYEGFEYRTLSMRSFSLR